MKPRNHYSILLLFVLCCSWLQGHGQIDPRLQVVNDHFAGSWVGMDYDYTYSKVIGERLRSEPVAMPLRIEITVDPKNGVLRLDCTFDTGATSDEHAVRFIKIDPAKRTLTLNWQGEPKRTDPADGLPQLLSTGYGGFVVKQKHYIVDGWAPDFRLTFQLFADRLSYVCEISEDGSSFHKTAEWTLVRKTGADDSVDAKPSQ